MVLYLSIISIATILAAILTIVVNSVQFFSLAALAIFGLSILTVVFEIALNGAVALIIHWLPKSWFLYERKIFKVFKWERKFYEKIQIKKWKDKVWELGGLGGFRKNKINNPNSPEYLTIFLMESNKGIVVHFIGIFVGFLCCLLFPQYFLTLGLPVSIVGVVLNILPMYILRYNIPKLAIARKRARQTQERLEKEKTSIE